MGQHIPGDPGDLNHVVATIGEPRRYTVAGGRLVSRLPVTDYLRLVATELGDPVALPCEPSIFGVPPNAWWTDEELSNRAGRENRAQRRARRR